jgi:signal transduction histidine kinase
MPTLLQSRQQAVVLDASDRKEFVATTVHELQLPLHHIGGFVSSLRRTDVEWDEETQREFLTEIEREADRLAELIESLLRGSVSQDTAKERLPSEGSSG